MKIEALVKKLDALFVKMNRMQKTEENSRDDSPSACARRFASREKVSKQMTEIRRQIREIDHLHPCG